MLGSAFITWYLSRRHCARMPQPVTENDIVMRNNEDEFRLAVIFFVLLLLVVVVMTLAFVYGV